ncbi:Cell division protein SepF [Acaryochloris thomasi RCC1774]|uniref:Cell division protein SepF n=1 Tax=Acaryochloris thomasi RCC1774 TaxID=1764569 RepID=A0A2W1JKX1_9CYAN|nr:cell division protein SepF [Acaryochloris thomasi]PZD70844.1 Cell division protein SepF [Acaryochloris thomasi RCC1774]
MENLLPFRQYPNNQILFLMPRSFEETRQAIESLKSGVVLLLNLKRFETQSAQRIADYTAGSACAISAHHIEISKDLFLLAPEHCKITTQI